MQKFVVQIVSLCPSLFFLLPVSLKKPREVGVVSRVYPVSGELVAGKPEHGGRICVGPGEWG
jgi:hypothetical protein